MNYELEISQSKPYSFTPLNGDRPSLVAGAGNSTALSSTPTTITFPLFQGGTEKSPFSIEVWFLPVSHNGLGEISVIGHGTEGVLWNGKEFILRVKQKAGAVFEQRWAPTNVGVFHIVQTWDTSKMTLFVNGQRQLEMDIPITDTFLSTTNISLHSLSGGAVASAMYDSAALYARTLTGQEIADHYSWGRSVLNSYEIAAHKGATTWTLTYNDVPVSNHVVFNWNNFLIEGLSNLDGRLTPDTSAGGTWTGSTFLSGATSAGIHLTYVGQGVTMSYSTDGTAWTVTPNKTTILEDVALVDATLFVKLQLADSNSWVDSLVADVLESRVMQPFSLVRPLSFKGAAFDQTPNNQLDFQMDWGARIRNGGYLEVQPDTQTPAVNTGTIELWAKVEGTAGFLVGNTGTNYVSITGGTYTFNGIVAYRNGALVPNGSYVANEFAHWVFVLTTPNNSPIRIGNNLGGTGALDVTVGHLAVYPQTMTAAGAASLYSFNVGAPALRIDDSSGVSVTEDAPATAIFAYSWSYVSGGR